MVAAAVFSTIMIAVAADHISDVPKWRIPGCYHIDRNFYPGLNAEWQYNHFRFEITRNDDFLFYEKLKDGSVKRTEGRVEYYRRSPPFLFRIEGIPEHPLVDFYPSHYRGNLKFYFVFESKFGNMFWRKVSRNGCSKTFANST